MLENKVVTVSLIKEKEEHFLVFNFDESIKLNLKSTSHDEIRLFFSSLISNLKNEEFILEFDKNNTEVTEVLVIEVAEEYVKQLNTDITKICADKDFMIFKNTSNEGSM